jgi:hypothetical protein
MVEHDGLEANRLRSALTRALRTLYLSLPQDANLWTSR